jgi:hypothetical protein
MLACVGKPASGASTTVAEQNITTLGGVQQPAQVRHRVTGKSSPQVAERRSTELMAKKTILKSPNVSPSVLSLVVGSGAKLPSAVEPASVNMPALQNQSPCDCSGNCGSQDHHDRTRTKCRATGLHQWLCNSGKRFTPKEEWSGDKGCVNCTCQGCLQRPRYRSALCKTCTASGSRSGAEPPVVVVEMPVTVALPVEDQTSQARDNDELIATIRVACPRLTQMWPCDMQAYMKGNRIFDWGMELIILLTKEPWAIDIFCSTLSSANDSPLASSSGLLQTRKTICDAFVSALEQGGVPARSPRAVWERRNISPQYGLVPLGLLSTAKRLGFLSKMHSSPSKFTKRNKKQIVLNGKMYVLHRRPAVCMQLLKRARALDASNPVACVNSLEELFAWCLDARQWLENEFGKAMAKYVIPHMIRKIWLRLEAVVARRQAQSMSRGKKSSSVNVADAEKAIRTFWKSKTIRDVIKLCPDSNGILQAFDGSVLASELWEQFGEHPLMISCWGCLFKEANRIGRIHSQSFEPLIFWHAEAGPVWLVFSQLTTRHGADAPPCPSVLVAEHFKMLPV